MTSAAVEKIVYEKLNKSYNFTKENTLPVDSVCPHSSFVSEGKKITGLMADRWGDFFHIGG